MTSVYQPTIADAALLADLGRRTFEQAFAAQNTPENMAAYLSVAYTTEQLEKELREENSVFYVAAANGTPVGYAKIHKDCWPDDESVSVAGPCVEINRLYVLQDSIGTGVGKLLMETCLQAARQQGYRTVWLGVWEHNARAIAFYRKWGFETFGSHIFQLGDDAQTDLLMKRSVS
ncbi:MAG: GNAT family N-acetyltransferase [Cytophagales bacterium]|jgi:ribosomal protein S18 acetylase RimI-like enzyme|nr:GNAT family N-acetyltransferase [Cytophagales bacterium]